MTLSKVYLEEDMQGTDWKFKENSEKFQAESLKLVAAARGGREDAFKSAFNATAGTCKTCHDDFRGK